MSVISIQSNKRPSKIWWLFAILIFVLCILVQMPASWIVQKYAPNNPYIEQVSGSLWQGSAILRLPIANNNHLSSSVSWQWQPLRLFFGKIGADIEISSGQTRLSGQVAIGVSSWQVKGLSGKISRDTLSSMLNWQLPDAPIFVNKVSLDYKKEQGMVDADGQFTWVGGELGYPSGNKMLQVMLPAMIANITMEKKGDNSLLLLHLMDNKDKRLGNFSLDKENMLDVNLTQRFLEYMPEYQGQAPKDSIVISVRQPLLSSLGREG